MPDGTSRSRHHPVRLASSAFHAVLHGCSSRASPNSHVCRIRLVPSSSFGSIAMSPVIPFGRDSQVLTPCWYVSFQIWFRTLHNHFGQKGANSCSKSSSFVPRSHDLSSPVVLAFRGRSSWSLGHPICKPMAASKSNTSRRGLDLPP